jgi:hypothetical protein
MRADLRRHTTDRLSSRTRRWRSGPRAARARPREGEPLIEPVAGPEERRVRESGGPDDRALYGCHCGCAFQAAVTASVACPRCGASQAW